MSAYQFTFAVCDIITPTLVTTALRHGATALWLPLSAIALLGIPVLSAVARRFPPLRAPVGKPKADLTREHLVVAEAG